LGLSITASEATLAAQQAAAAMSAKQFDPALLAIVRELEGVLQAQ
jgi:hypothetical protein